MATKNWTPKIGPSADRCSRKLNGERIQQHLLTARMAADSTFLVNKTEPGHSTKLEYLDELFEQLWNEPERKVLLFSEWTTMLDLIMPRVLAGERIGRKDIALMGHGGLCLDCKTCLYPHCPFGK